jgi:hypothetical protein
MERIKQARQKAVIKRRTGGSLIVRERGSVGSAPEKNTESRKLESPLENKRTKQRLRRAARQPDGWQSSLPDIGKVPLFVRNVAAWRGLGYTFSQIGRSCGVSPQAISIMMAREKRRLSSELDPSEFTGLSPRAVNCLGRLGISSRAAAQKTQKLEDALLGQRNCGEKTVREILSWATVNAPGPQRM